MAKRCIRVGIRASICVVIWAVCPACDEEPRRGGVGESCNAANDCNDGLACFAQICSAKIAADVGADAGSSGEGASCSARRDCAPGLSCVQNACQAMSVGSEPGTRYSGAGESCQAKNDCTPELSCVMTTCRDTAVGLPQLSKSCYRVECATQADCCASFVPNANCDMYKANCQTDPIFCNTYRSLCQCNMDCQDELCVMAANGCMSNAECTSTQTPFCVDNQCRQCGADTDCSGSDGKCVDGTCMAPCSADENCPLLEQCQDGACVQTGCQSDRECAFLMHNAQTKCSDGMCSVPCSDDVDCANDKNTTGFDTCQDGVCKFIGCDNDSECRALLGLANQKTNVRAVCR
jgi:hypothetical protein